jgi:hypothetical protein
VVIAPTPGRALRDAGTVVALLAGLVGVGIFMLSASVVDAVAPQYRPWDDLPWLALNSPELAPDAFEEATGMTQEAVILKYGPPMRVRRDRHLPDDCVQAYVYVTRVLGERTTDAVCFNAAGRVTSFVGQTVSFDLRSMTDDPRESFAATALLSAILALPLAGLLAIRRRRQLRLPSLSLAAPLPQGGRRTRG